MNTLFSSIRIILSRFAINEKPFDVVDALASKKRLASLVAVEQNYVIAQPSLFPQI